MRTHTPILTLALAACSATNIVGTWDDGFGSTYTISEETVVQAGDGFSSTYHVEEFGGRYLLAENDAANAYDPGMYSRFDWTEDAGTTYLCQSAYAAPDLDAARAATADDGDLEGGCGGFGWSALSAAP